MNKQRLLELAGINEVKYTGIIGTIAHEFSVDVRDDAYRLAQLIHSPSTGWHATVKEGHDGYWVVRIVANVDPKNFT